MRKSSFLCATALGIILLQGSFYEASAMMSAKKAAAAHTLSEADLGKLERPSAMRRHQIVSERIQAELDELIRQHKDSLSTGKDTVQARQAYYDTADHIKHEEEMFAKLRTVYEDLGLNFQSLDSAALAASQKRARRKASNYSSINQG